MRRKKGIKTHSRLKKVFFDYANGKGKYLPLPLA
jgi:hypothetical protein